jgi:hypothetical protein
VQWVKPLREQAHAGMVHRPFSEKSVTPSGVVGRVPRPGRDDPPHSSQSTNQVMLTLKAVSIAAPAARRGKFEAIAGTRAVVRHFAALRPRGDDFSSCFSQGQPTRPRSSMARPCRRD